MQWLIDLDGVVWRFNDAIPGAGEAVRLLREAGHSVYFVTNNSTLSRGDYVTKLARFDVTTSEDRIITSAMAAAYLLDETDTVLIIGEPGLVDEIRAKCTSTYLPVEVPKDFKPSVVVVGWYRKFSYSDMEAACIAIRAGARFIATNRDATYPKGGIIIPGTGALVASISASAEVEPTFAGKPDYAMVALMASELHGESVMVGDRLTTDGRFAHRLGAHFIHVTSGIDEIARPEIPVTMKASTLLVGVKKYLEENDES
ncbi:MAG: HAD-IIA family hydrolase [Ferrimicrobium sp.]